MTPRGGGPSERTSLSWQRSELAVAFVAAFVAAAAVRLEVTWIAVVGGLIAVTGLGAALAGRPQEAHDDLATVPPWPWLPRIAVAAAIIGVLGAALGIVEVLRRV